ncbi:TetR/AcrR family transcriptional regulator [Kitasatospora sp. NPDC092948]|uniref:TetR/AcrR family transcriptional regulator n=1 Tax=Kitasatospora sp. NPDC092948 TaxID=3364088 RepID=UPI0038266844
MAQRPKRADGARNYDAILAAARRAFESHGAEAALEDVASQAGVAIGTLYRHFPTRAALVEAATRDGLAELVEHAEQTDTSADTLGALTEWMHRAVRHFSTFRGLVGILAQSMYDEGTPSHAACSAMHDSGAQLLARAQEAGLVRPELTPDELFDLLSAVAWVRENATADRDGSAQLLDHFLTGVVLPH